MYTKQVKEFGRMARFDDEPCEVRGAPPPSSPRRVENSPTPRSNALRSRVQHVLTFADASPSPQVVSDLRPEPELKEDYIERNPMNTVVQVAPDQSEHDVRRAIPADPPFSLRSRLLPPSSLPKMQRLKSARDRPPTPRAEPPRRSLLRRRTR